MVERNHREMTNGLSKKEKARYFMLNNYGTSKNLQISRNEKPNGVVIRGRTKRR